MGWPLSQDYNEAIQNPTQCFADPDLRSGAPLCNALGLPQPCSGNFADVYAVLSGPRKWAVKCFTREVRGLRERYTRISEYLARLNLPFLIECRFLDEGIRIGGRWYPVVKMQWIEGQTLNDFVREHAGSPPLLQTLAVIWRKMDSRLREGQMAHGDLQHGNVLLVRGRKDGSLAVRLVDYDGMCVPALEQLKSAEVGHPNYQHPQRLREGAYGRDMDRFAHLAIYTALRALVAGGKALWERFDDGDNLLFKQADFEDPAKSAVLQELSRVPDTEVRKLAAALQEAARGPVAAVPTLDTVIGARPLTGVHPEPRQAVTTKPVSTPAPPSAPQAQAVQTQPVAAAGFDNLREEESKPKRRRRKAGGRSMLPVVIGAAGVLVGLVVGIYIAIAPSPGTPVAGKSPKRTTAKTAPTEKATAAANLGAWSGLHVAIRHLDSDPEVAGRLPVPAEGAQERICNEVKFRHAAELGKKDPGTLRLVAEHIQQRAWNAQPGSEMRFGALVVSRDLAALAGDVPLAMRSAELLVEEFAVDAWQVKRSALKLAEEKSSRKDVQQAVAETALVVAEEALDANSFEAAGVLLDFATTTAGTTKDARLVRRINERAAECRLAKEEFARVKPALDRLAAAPMDPATNQTAGVWYGCWKGDWDRALPLLKRGDAAWKPAAEADLKRPAGAAEKKAVGDRWWDLAEGQSERVQAGLRAHAADWYQEVLSELPEMAKADVEARLAQVGEDTRARIDLLKLLEVDRAPSIGRWASEKRTLLPPSPVRGTETRIQFPYILPPEYRLKLLVERLEGIDALTIGTVFQGQPCRVVLDGWPGAGGRSGLEWIDGRRCDANETTRAGLLLTKDALSEVDITVRKGEYQTLVNGNEVFTFKGESARLSLQIGRFPAHPGALWVGAYESVFRIRKLELVPLSGRGRKVPYPPDPEPVKDGVYLSDLPQEPGARVGAGALGVNGELGYDGPGNDTRIKVNWKHYAKGISTHATTNAPSSVAYNLDGKFKKFSGVAAVSDSAFVPELPGPASPLFFSVLADNKEVWKSSGLQKWKETAPFDIDVAGVQRLELHVNCTNHSWGHAVWLDPVLQR
jgi:hypothetical protein